MRILSPVKCFALGYDARWMVELDNQALASSELITLAMLSQSTEPQGGLAVHAGVLEPKAWVPILVLPMPAVSLGQVLVCPSMK